MPRLSYITVCVNYLDYFKITFQHNRSEFDDFTVVTTPTDTATQEFCRDNHLTCVVTDVFYRGGAVFNKGAGLNGGLIAAQQLRPLEWVCLMDADTFVPSTQPRAIIPALDKEWFYGCERYLLPTVQDYTKWTEDNGATFEAPKGFGFGYFQLFHWDSEVIKGLPYGQWYPAGWDCTEVDWKFFRPWGNLINDYTDSEGKMAKLPFRVYNLGPHGVNHQKRVSPSFV